MSFIILWKILLATSLLFTLKKTVVDEETGTYFHDDNIREVIIQVIIIMILLAQAITYWKIRKRIARKGFVWGHIGGLLLAFVIAPMALTVYATWLSMNSGVGNYGREIIAAGAVLGVLVWASLIIAHICFVLVLIYAFKKRKEEPETPASDSPDMA